MIPDPQALSLADVLIQIGERIESAPADLLAPQAMPAPPSGDAITLTAARTGGPATSLADAAALALTSGAAAKATAVGSTLSGLLRDLAATPGGASYADPAAGRGVSALLSALASSGSAALPAAAPLGGLIAVVRAALDATTVAGANAFREQLRDVLAADPAALSAALHDFTPTQTGTAAVAAPPLAALPPFDPSLRDAPGGAANSTSETLARRAVQRTLVTAIPERDPHGRRYGESARRRLAQLGVDPRHGFAPEAEVALAAEERWGVAFVRAFDEPHDFVDATGRSWNVLVPRDLRGFDAALRLLSRDAGVLVSGALLAAPERAEALALVAHKAARPTGQPIVAVDAPSEIAWPG